jgi:hypothetical protein
MRSSLSPGKPPSRCPEPVWWSPTCSTGTACYAVGGISADVVIHQLTALSKPPAKFADMELTNTLRTIGPAHLIPAPDDQTRSTNSTIVYNPTSNTWRTAAPMRTARERHRLVAANGYLYAIGGRAEGPSLATVERYDPRQNRWQDITPMHESRVVPCAVQTTIGNRHVTGPASRWS